VLVHACTREAQRTNQMEGTREVVGHTSISDIASTSLQNYLGTNTYNISTRAYSKTGGLEIKYRSSSDYPPTVKKRPIRSLKINSNVIAFNPAF
jgi:hypothetical protein